jgi:environmental stress-induced protein Ves
VRLIELADIAPQPWRNGGGVTRELLAWPDAADWALRLSVADIARDGPFSAFDGVDRWFAVLAGHGVRLDWPGRSVTVRGDDAPFGFDGGTPPDATLLEGPTRDLNLMLRRGRATGTLACAAPAEPWFSTAPWRGVLTLAPAMLAVAGQSAQAMPPWSLVFARDAAGQVWRLHAEAAARAYWIAASPV